jgi:hypothetical protein
LLDAVFSSGKTAGKALFVKKIRTRWAIISSISSEPWFSISVPLQYGSVPDRHNSVLFYYGHLL